MSYSGDSTTTAGTIIDVKQYFDTVLLDRALPNLSHLQFGQRRPIPKNGGKSVTTL